MISGTATKTRFVRCPKCWKLLQEAGFPVYQCGGCGVLLQAKNHGNSTRTSPTDFREVGSVQRDELEHVPKDKESSSSRQEAVSSASQECSLDKRNERDDVGDFHTKQPEVDFSSGVSSTARHENVDFSDKIPLTIEWPEDVNLLNGVSLPMKQSEDMDISDEGSSSKVQPEDVNFTNEVSSSMVHPKGVNNSNEGSLSNVQAEDINISNQGSSHMQHEDVDFLNEGSSNLLPEDTNFLNEVSSSVKQPEDVRSSNLGSSLTYHPEETFLEEVSSPTEQPADVNFSNEVSASMQQPEDVDCLSEVSLTKGQYEDVDFLGELSPSKEQHEDVNLNEASSSNMQPEDRNFSNEFSSFVGKPVDMSFSNQDSSSKAWPEDIVSSEISSPIEPEVINLDEVSSAREQSEDVDFSDEVSPPKEQPQDINVSNEGSSSIVQPEGVSFSVAKQPEDVHSSNQVSSLTGQPEEVLSNEVSSPKEHLEDVILSNEASSPMVQPEDVDYLNEVSSPKEQPGDNNFSNELSSSKNQPDNLNFLNEASSSMEKSKDMNFLNEVSLSTALECHDIEGPGSLLGAARVDEGDERGCYPRNLSSDRLLASTERNSEIPTLELTEEYVKWDPPISHSNEQPDQSEDDFVHGFYSSMDTLESREVVNPISELSNRFGYIYRSPTARSYYGYDGSVSSFDGTDDQVLDRPLQIPNRTFKPRKFVGPEQRSRSKFLMNSKLEMQHQTRNPSSVLSGEEHYPQKYGKWNKDDSLEPPRYEQPLRSSMRLVRGEIPTTMAFSGRDFPTGYENDNHLSPEHPDYCSLSFDSSDKPEWHQWERIKLLKMMYELQDGIRRKQNGRGPTKVGRKGKHIAKSYNYETSEETFNDLNYPMYHNQCSTGRNWLQHRKFSRMAFSGEAPTSRQQADYSYLHCCPQETRYSAQLAPPYLFKNGLHGTHPAHGCYHCCTSTHSSPVQCMNSEIPMWTHVAESEGQGHKKHEAKFYWKEKRHQVKRSIQPIAGGAPLLTCYHCSHLLQLPTDFLLFKRRCHGLRCGACHKVLKFSVENTTHLVRYTPNAVVPPPPSEVDDISRTLNSVDFASNTLVSDPVSCSDDYGLSFCKSFSTEGEPAFIARPFEPKERNKFISKPSVHRHKKPRETCVGPSSKTSKAEKSCTEIEELPPKGSPLYWLMHYASPSALINGSGVFSD